jgi:hypothetical protein
LFGSTRRDEEGASLLLLTTEVDADVSDEFGTAAVGGTKLPILKFGLNIPSSIECCSSREIHELF